MDSRSATWFVTSEQGTAVTRVARAQRFEFGVTRRRLRSWVTWFRRSATRQRAARRDAVHRRGEADQASGDPRQGGDRRRRPGHPVVGAGGGADPFPYALYLISLTLAYSWVVTALWGADRVLGAGVVTAGLLACLRFHLKHSRGIRAWGWSGGAFFPALVRDLVPTAVIAVASLLVGWQLQSIRWRDQLGRLFIVLLLWAAAQQWALLTLVLGACRRRTRHPALVAGLIFGALHLPNPLLSVATACLGWYWSRVFLRYPNFLPAALSHAGCSFIALNTLPRWLTGGMRIGAGWFGG